MVTKEEIKKTIDDLPEDALEEVCILLTKAIQKKEKKEIPDC
jgi:hypothetical protein